MVGIILASGGEGKMEIRYTATLVLLLAMLEPLRATGHPTKVFFGDVMHPVVSGELWLIANRWGWYQAVLVGTVREGRLEERQSIQFPQYWEQAFDYKLLLAVSDQAVEPPKSVATDDAYGWFGRRPEYLEHFSTVYLSTPLAKENGGKDWRTAFRELGHLTDGDLVLPRPARRTIRLLYPDGKPLAGTRLLVSLYGSSANHCGVAVGIWLGDFVTSGEGEIHLVAPKCAIAIGVRYFQEVAGGPTGTAFALWDNLVIRSDAATTVKRLWTLPKHDYVLRLRTAANQPIARAHLEGCLFQPPCMSGCGPLGAPESDASGVIRFRENDLRELGSITLVKAEGAKRNLTDSEMRELLTTYRLSLLWK
jgi:hypothetical protein